MVEVDYYDSDRDKDDNVCSSTQLLASQSSQERISLESEKDARKHCATINTNKGDVLSLPVILHSDKSVSTCFSKNRNWKVGISLILMILACIGLLHQFTKSSDVQSPLSVSGFSGPRNTFIFSNGTRFIRPPELKVIGIVFYGRRQFVNILECYLRRNLRVNGGILDEVHFLLHTDVQKDIKWLRRLVKRDGLGKYYKLKGEDTSGNWLQWKTYQMLYKKHMTDTHSIYIKIDDDVVFIDDYAIPELVRTLLEHPEALNIQTNTVNNKWNHWHHFRTNAIWPYLIDQNVSAQWSEDTWRPSQLPPYKGRLPPKNPDAPNSFDYQAVTSGHRWLPLEPSPSNLARTPYGQGLRNPMYKDKPSDPGWPVAAQAHYSFFENYERGQLSRFSFGGAHDYTWNRWYIRYNINMMAIRGSIIKKTAIWNQKGHPGDEIYFTVKGSKDLAMPVLVATRAIISHFSFRKERDYVLKTDILDRYRALANEYYCPSGGYRHHIGRRRNPHQILSFHKTAFNHESNIEDDDIGDGPQDLYNKQDSAENTDATVFS